MTAARTEPHVTRRHVPAPPLADAGPLPSPLPSPLRGGFPNPVNETSARLVAAGVVAQGAAFLAVQRGWVLVPLVYGFVARVLFGPRCSPLGAFVTRVVTPRLAGPHRFVAGQPKRFAQGVGVAFSAAAAVAWLAGSPVVAVGLIIALCLAATLEAVFGLCVGCVAFGQLIRLGVIPRSVCAECADISARLARLAG